MLLNAVRIPQRFGGAVSDLVKQGARRVSTLISEDPYNKKIEQSNDAIRRGDTLVRPGLNRFSRDELTFGVENSIKLNQRVQQIATEKPLVMSHVGGFTMDYVHEDGTHHKVPESVLRAGIKVLQDDVAVPYDKVGGISGSSEVIAQHAERVFNTDKPIDPRYAFAMPTLKSMHMAWGLNVITSGRSGVGVVIPTYHTFTTDMKALGAKLFYINAYVGHSEAERQANIVRGIEQLAERGKIQSLYLVGPRNPDGQVYSRRTIEDISFLADAYDLNVFFDAAYVVNTREPMDEVNTHLGVFSGEHSSGFHITAGSGSKLESNGMAGNRVAWGLTNRPETYMDTVNVLMSHPPAIGQHLLIESLKHYAENKPDYDQRVDEMSSYQRGLFDSLKALDLPINIVEPAAPPFVLADFSNMATQFGTDDAGIRDYLLEGNPEIGISTAIKFGPQQGLVRFSVSSWKSESDVDQFRDASKRLLTDYPRMAAFFSS